MEGRKWRITRKEWKTLTAILATKRMLEDRGAVSNGGGNLVRGYKSTHEENFLRACWREDKEGMIKEEEEEKIQGRRDTEMENSGGGRYGKGRSEL